MIPAYLVLRHRCAHAQFKGFNEDGAIERLVIRIGKLEFSFTTDIAFDWNNLDEDNYRLSVAKNGKLSTVKDIKTDEVAGVNSLVTFTGILYMLTDESLEDAQYQKLKENFRFALGNSRHILGESYILRTMGAIKLVDLESNQREERSTAMTLLTERKGTLVNERIKVDKCFGNATPSLRGYLVYHYKGYELMYKVDAIDSYEPEYYNEHTHSNSRLVCARDVESTRRIFYLESGGNLYINPDLYLEQEIPEYYHERAKFLGHDDEFHNLLLGKGFVQLI